MSSKVPPMSGHSRSQQPVEPSKISQDLFIDRIKLCFNTLSVAVHVFICYCRDSGKALR